jgi:hypothetical protein
LCVTTYFVASIPGEIVFVCGIVQKTSFAPAEKSTRLFELVDEITVCLDNVSGLASVTVPIPTSNSSCPVF